MLQTQVRLITLFLLLAPSLCWAQQLVLLETANIKAERIHHFRAQFTQADGRIRNVTNEATFKVTNARAGSVSGAFEFGLSPNTGATVGNEIVEIRYRDENGRNFVKSSIVRVSYVPDRVELIGPAQIKVGERAKLIARGDYAGRLIDISNRGRWSALKGQVTAGHYRTPQLPPNTAKLEDQISYTFGQASANHALRVVR